MRLSRGIGAVLAVLALTACSGGGPESDIVAEAMGQDSGCVTLDADVAQAVEDGAVGDLTVHDGMAVRADSGVYYAAFRITAAGADEMGVWALDGLPPTGIRSVDGYAQEFSAWPVLQGANGSPDARAAVACLD